MTIPTKLVGSVLATALCWSSSAFAGCNAVQVAGVWEVAFSDGNSCNLKLKNNGSVDTNNSICYDPSRGTAGVDSGNLKPAGNCFAEGNIVVEGIKIELPVQFSHDRSVAAGRFLFTNDGTKGSVVMVRMN